MSLQDISDKEKVSGVFTTEQKVLIFIVFIIVGGFFSPIFFVFAIMMVFLYELNMSQQKDKKVKSNINLTKLLGLMFLALLLAIGVMMLIAIILTL